MARQVPRTRQHRLQRRVAVVAVGGEGGRRLDVRGDPGPVVPRPRALPVKGRDDDPGLRVEQFERVALADEVGARPRWLTDEPGPRVLLDGRGRVLGGRDRGPADDHKEVAPLVDLRMADEVTQQGQA